jgi:hypothetical protein
VLSALAAAERAWDVVTGALALPAPDADLTTGKYDVVLADDVEGSAATLLSERDVRSRVDRASAFTLLDARVAPGCSMDALLARESARASLLRAAPATDEGSARAETVHLAELAFPCATGPSAPELDFQTHPERAVIDTWTEAPRVGASFDRGAALFFRWIDAFADQPGGIVRAMWALSPTITPLGAWRWVNEPDGWDVLRTSFKNVLADGSSFDDALLDFAIARATWDGAPRARTDWDIDWPDRPRRLASPVGVAPTGAAYVTIRRGGAAPDARLRLEVAWEQHARMRWAVAKLDAGGKLMSRVVVGSPDRATEAQMTVVDVGVDAGEAATLLVVGVSLGDFAYPLDPDDETWEPHGWLLTVGGE